MYSADIRARTYITKVLEEAIHTISDEQTIRDYAFELALCFKLGFGVDSNPKYEDYLIQSQRDLDDLLNEIYQLGESQPVYRNRTYLELRSKGYVLQPTIQEQSTKREEQENIINKLKRSYLISDRT